MHSVPVPGSLALIRQNQRQIHDVKSFQNTQFCKLVVTDVLRLDCSRQCLTSQEREIFIKKYLLRNIIPASGYI